MASTNHPVAVADAQPEADVVSTETIVRPATRRVRMRQTCEIWYSTRSYSFTAGEWIELPDEVATYVTEYGMTFDT